MGQRTAGIFGLRKNGQEFPADAAISKLTVGGTTILTVTLRDISQQGARVEGEAAVAVDQHVRLEIPGIANVVAKVRWKRSGALGLVFEQTYRLDELAGVVMKLQG